MNCKRLAVLISVIAISMYLTARPVLAADDTWDVLLDTTISERYDDNIDLEEDNEEDDFITSFTPHLGIARKTSATDLLLSYSPSFEVYADNSDENEVRHNGTLSCASRLTPRLHLAIQDSLSFTSGQNTERDDAYQARGRRLRNTSSDLQSNNLSGTLSYNLFRATSIRAFGSYRFDDYDQSEEVDSDEYEAGAGIDHQLTSRDVIFSEYSYRIIEYDEGSLDDDPILGPDPTAGLYNDTDIQSVTIGDRHSFPRDVTLSVSGGVMFIDEKDQDEETELQTSVSLAKAFRTGDVVLSFNRDASAGSGSGDPTTFEEYNLTVNKTLARHLTASGSVYYTTEESVSGNEVDTEDTGFIASLSYQFSRNLTGTLDGSYIQQDSSDGAVMGIDGGGDSDSYRTGCLLDYRIRRNWSVFTSYRYYRQEGDDQNEGDFDNNVIEAGTRITWF